MTEIVPSELIDGDYYQQQFVENALDDGFGKLTRPEPAAEEGDHVEMDGITFDVVSVDSRDIDDMDAPEEVIEQLRDASEDGVVYTHRLEPRE